MAGYRVVREPVTVYVDNAVYVVSRGTLTKIRAARAQIPLQLRDRDPIDPPVALRLEFPGLDPGADGAFVQLEEIRRDTETHRAARMRVRIRDSGFRPAAASSQHMDPLLLYTASSGAICIESVQNSARD
jgi:hypothetical protein